MNYTFEWIEAPWLLRANLGGFLTVPKYEQFCDERLRYLDSVDGHLYIICDWGEVSDLLTPEVMKTIANSSVHRHPNIGVMASVGNQMMLKFMVSVVAQRNPSGSDKPAATRYFETMQEAEQFCRAVAAVDQRRAKMCQYVPTPDQV